MDCPVLRCGAILALTRVSLTSVALLALAGCSSQIQDAPAADTSADELSRLKLLEEVRKLRFDTDRADSSLGILLAVGPFITVLVAILTLGFTFWKHLTDREAALDKDRLARTDQQKKDRDVRQDQQDKDRQLRFDTLFATATSQLASTEPGLQLAGAASLLRLQGSTEDRMQREIILFCAAQLRLGAATAVSTVIKDVLADALRRTVADSSMQPLTALNLEGADLSGIDLHGVDLHRIELHFAGANLTGSNLEEADLSGADLTGATLYKSFARRVRLNQANCSKANFGPSVLIGAELRRTRLSGARMGSANLRGADLSRAYLRGAALQSAHFDNATLNRTDFTGADINDAYFSGATINSDTLATLLEADNGDRAHGLPAPAPAQASGPP